TSRQATESTV
nr:Chain C, Protein E6 [human papillomavirus 66]8B8O_D Chain D, Protein E6 [human papillomavirus 66]